jgi:hypothetical protein
LENVPPPITKAQPVYSALKLSPRCRHRYFGLDSVSASLRRSAVEIALEFGTTRDYRSRPFLQLALCSFEEWSPDLHMQILSQGNFFIHGA